MFMKYFQSFNHLEIPYQGCILFNCSSCFPTTIINRVLMCGLKEYSSSQSEAKDEKQKLASVVGILGHLASQHSHDIRKALMTLFKVSLMWFLKQQLTNHPACLIENQTLHWCQHFTNVNNCCRIVLKPRPPVKNTVQLYHFFYKWLQCRQFFCKS